MPVPDGLDGMRVDAGLARLLGLSRTAVAALAEEGAVLLDGTPADQVRTTARRRLARGRTARAEAAELDASRPNPSRG